MECFVFVLFEPLKSADPPINSGKFFVIFSKTKAEDCLEAILDFKSKNFSSLKILCGYQNLQVVCY